MDANKVKKVSQRTNVVRAVKEVNISLFKKNFSTRKATALKRRVMSIYPRSRFSMIILNRIIIKRIKTIPPVPKARTFNA